MMTKNKILILPGDYAIGANTIRGPIGARKCYTRDAGPKKWVVDFSTPDPDDPDSDIRQITPEYDSHAVASMVASVLIVAWSENTGSEIVDCSMIPHALKLVGLE